MVKLFYRLDMFQIDECVAEGVLVAAAFLLLGHVQKVELVVELLVYFQQQQLLVINRGNVFEHESCPAVEENVLVLDLK